MGPDTPSRRRRAAAALLAAAAAVLGPGACVGRDADAWLAGDLDAQVGLAAELVAFEEQDDRQRAAPGEDRFAGEWALVTHQMTALGLAQVALAHPELRAAYAPVVARAAAKTFLPEMRAFGTRAWRGEDAFASLDGPHGHAYLGYAALAVGVARALEPTFPADVAQAHDALVHAFARRLLASPVGLVETYPGEAYPTDVAAVAAAIAVHGRATGADHARVLAHWVAAVRAAQIDPRSGLLFQRARVDDAAPSDAPRGSGTALAAYFAGFVDRALAASLADGVFRHGASFARFGAIREYADGHSGGGDVDSGPVLFGVSVAATGFALAPARALGRSSDFRALFRTAALFGAPVGFGGRRRFATGDSIGNAILLAMLTSGPEWTP